MLIPALSSTTHCLSSMLPRFIVCSSILAASSLLNGDELANSRSITEPTAEPCDSDWFFIEGTCYCMNTTHVTSRDEDRSWYSVKELCQGMGGTLPIIHNPEQNEELLNRTSEFFTHSTTNKDIIEFWIGLIYTNGNFSWIDGSPYDYDNLRGYSAQSNSGFSFLENGEWNGYGRQNQAVLVVCSKAPFQSTTAETTDAGLTSSVSNERTTMTSTTTFPTIQSSTEMSTSSSTSTTTTENPDTGIPSWEIAAIVVGSIFLLLLSAAIVLFLLRSRKKIHDLREIVEIRVQMDAERQNKEVRTFSNNAKSERYYTLPGQTDEWEIERRFVGIEYMSKLGEGAFGNQNVIISWHVLAKNIPPGVGRSIVELSALKNEHNAVAVKLLHENADAATEKDFRAEIKLMKQLGYHERLVNMLASVTKTDPVLLIAEYCSNGDLLDFMRRRRKYMLEHADDIDETMIITVKKQKMFAAQIAYGLEYLSVQGFVHRDIAARNIMVDHQETCKIGDFGLCRTVEKELKNYHAHGGKLPLKWMPPEAIEKYNFSVASDVWSYGILLFELVTLGGIPYAGWPAAEILARLKQGDRMERPDHCSDRMFEVMSRCWAGKPSDRPTFTQLRKRLGVLLEDVNQDEYYLQLNAHANYYVLESNTDESS